MKKFLLVSLLALLPLVALAQSANLLSMARSELDKRGLAEPEVRIRLLENGIDVDNIPPTEYASYQNRIVTILDQMQAERSRVPGQDTTQFRANAVPMQEQPALAVQERIAEAVPEVPAEPDSLEIYGHALFAGNALDVFRTTDGAQAPETYVLGEGDEVHISIFGSSQTEIHQRVGADGSIQPVGSAKIFLKGLTLAQARTAVRTKLAQHYSFRQDQIAVTITTARTITASIYGEVGVQGGYTLSALNTAFNALAAAGGPSAIGSVRNIQRSRGGHTSTLDLYKYMTGASGDVAYDLQNGDVLFVPVAAKVVRVEGAVNRPMRYEVVDNETIADVIRYAGGLAENAYPDFVQLERRENGRVSYSDYDLNRILSGEQRIVLQNGDVVRLRATENLDEQYVAVEGDVYLAGRYDIRENRDLATLIENARPRYTAKMDNVFVERTHDDETVEIITVPFLGAGAQKDFVLQPRDKVIILEQATYRDVDTISVNGQVRRPFSREFGLKDRMTVAQAIEFAGGLKTSVYPVAYVFRKDVTNPEKMEYLRINLERDGDVQLRPGDQLNVYDNTTYTNIGEVRVSGAVKYPLATAYDAKLTVRDLLTMAGGLEVGAAYNRVEVFRVNISSTEEVKYDRITLSVDNDLNVQGGEFQLQPYDNIVVRMTPNFATNRYVQISGRVKYPGTYPLEDSRTSLSQVIKMAGGLLPDAEPYASIFREFNSRGSIAINLDNLRHSPGNVSSDPFLMEGDVINIVRQENTVTIRGTATQMGQYAPEGMDYTQRTVVYNGAHGAKWYIRKYAGGFTKTADRNSVTITYPNGQSEGTGRFLFFRTYPTVHSGGVISVSVDADKLRELQEPKDKVDFENIIAKGLTGLSSIASIVILARSLATK